MATLAEIKQKLDDTQVALDAEQQQVADLLAQNQTTITTLNETIAALQAQQTDGGTPEERQAILDSLTGLKTDLEATVAP